MRVTSPDCSGWWSIGTGWPASSSTVAMTSARLVLVPPATFSTSPGATVATEASAAARLAATTSLT